MAKGFYTQGCAVLFAKPPTVAALAEALEDFEIGNDAEPAEHWHLGGPGFLVAYRPEDNGHVMVDVVDRPWPDDMGDPADDPTLFASWSMGQFGPFAFPGGVERAAAQCWRDRDLGARVRDHGAFVRVRLSYIFDAADDAPVMPEGCDSRHELDFVTRLTAALCRVEGALAYLNPGGEVLASTALLEQSLGAAADSGLPTLDLWSNIRLFNADPEWCLMDSVGNLQVELPDLEVAFQPAVVDPGEVDPFIRNATLYLLDQGPVIGDGDTVDGPAGLGFRVHAVQEGAVDPPRPVLRLLPEGATELPPGLVPDEEAEGGSIEEPEA